MSLARLVMGPKEAGGGGAAAIISDPEKEGCRQLSLHFYVATFFRQKEMVV